MLGMGTRKTVFADRFDNNLGYKRSQTNFETGQALNLDEAYRLAHLPLVNPNHPDCIRSVSGKTYDMGQHVRIHSCVLPIPQDLLEASQPFQALEAEIKASSFGKKIAWDIVERRRGRLHATICGSLREGETPPVLPFLEKVNPLRVQIKGLFSGNINVGRLYLMVHPEKHTEINAIQTIQKTLARPMTDLYLVGLYNFTDHLTAGETTDLAHVIDRWWTIPLLTFDSDTLWLMSSTDDLVLDSRVETVVQLKSNPRI
jgi:hypothetical protein